jgi:D-glycero-D-manno-heptose 1,7-bisphosphate phosphatase
LIVKLQLRSKQVCVATNQQCVGKGLINLHDLNILHNKINQSIITNGGNAIKFYICPHLELASCLCRKPMPGLIVKASADFEISKNRILFIGDKLSDSLAATAAEVDFYYMNYQD